jgi:hypothetical protein
VDGRGRVLTRHDQGLVAPDNWCAGEGVGIGGAWTGTARTKNCLPIVRIFGCTWGDGDIEGAGGGRCGANEVIPIDLAYLRLCVI